MEPTITMWTSSRNHVLAMNTKEMTFHVLMHSLLSYFSTTHSLLYFCRNFVQFKLVTTNFYSIVFGPHVLPLIPNLTQTQTQKQKNSHIMLLTLISLADSLRKNDIDVVRLAIALLEHKNTSALYAASQGITHAHVGLLITEFYLFLYFFFVVSCYSHLIFYVRDFYY